jgi:methyl-accepting chemotaxis protein
VSALGDVRAAMLQVRLDGSSQFIAQGMAAKTAAAQTFTADLARVNTAPAGSIMLLVVGLALALAVGILVARQIVRSLGPVKDVCSALADGDLTRQGPGTGNGAGH